jgi:hypothetical protein
VQTDKTKAEQGPHINLLETSMSSEHTVCTSSFLLHVRLNLQYYLPYTSFSYVLINTGYTATRSGVPD